MSTNPVVIFDIDGVLCRKVSEGSDATKEVAEKLRLDNPEMPVILAQYKSIYDGRYSAERKYVYMCLPYTKVLFKYLMNNGARIVFFSAGEEPRNIALLTQLLTQVFGELQYEYLKQQDQFKIFSEQHLRSCHKDPERFEPGRNVKDMLHAGVLQAGEDIKDSILIEDQPSFTAHDQRPCIRAIDIEFRCGKEDFQRNGGYYLLGLFKVYFETLRVNNLNLKEGMWQILGGDSNKEQKKDSIYWSNADEIRYRTTPYYPKEDLPFTLKTIKSGYAEVLKEYSDAQLYGRTLQDNYNLMLLKKLAQSEDIHWQSLRSKDYNQIIGRHPLLNEFSEECITQSAKLGEIDETLCFDLTY